MKKQYCTIIVLVVLSLSCAAKGQSIKQNNVNMACRTDGTLNGYGTLIDTKLKFMSVTIADKTYSGNWVFVGDGNSVPTIQKKFRVGNIGVVRNTHRQDTGDGKSILKSHDNSTITCDFKYSKSSKSGFGTCSECTDNGRVYDIIIQ